jgi:hypothetical protein
MEVFLALILFCLIIAFIAVPLWRRPEAEPEAAASAEDRAARLADLEARKEAKYREIRDTEMDHASGKLTKEAFTRQDAALRADAVGILEQIDALRESPPVKRPL